MSHHFQRGHAALRMARRRRDRAMPPSPTFADLPPVIAFPNFG